MAQDAGTAHAAQARRTNAEEEEAPAHVMAHDAWQERRMITASSLRAQCATLKEKKHGGAVARDCARCLAGTAHKA